LAVASFYLGLELTLIEGLPFSPNSQVENKGFSLI
jgi:hypothetical protein